MITLLRPGRDAIDGVLRAADARSAGAPPFSHPDVGATRRPEAIEALRGRYTIDRRRFSLGRGSDLFDAAKRALLGWRCFEIAWLELEGRETPVREGQAVATLTRLYGLWFLNPCRVVYREDDPGSPHAAAFAYGTLAGHVACGEERFALSCSPSSEEVEFEIVAFSRPAMPLTRIGRPFMRRIQRRFAADAAAALAGACPGLGAKVQERPTGPGRGAAG